MPCFHVFQICDVMFLQQEADDVNKKILCYDVWSAGEIKHY